MSILSSSLSPSYSSYSLCPSCPSFTASGITWEGAAGGIYETAAYFSLFHSRHPLHWLSVLSVRAPTVPPFPLSHPYVAWRAVLIYRSGAPLSWWQGERVFCQEKEAAREHERGNSLVSCWGHSGESHQIPSKKLHMGGGVSLATGLLFTFPFKNMESL